MDKNKLLRTAVEICLIIVISAAAGTAWNWKLLSGAWRGELAQQAEAASPAQELLPMPIGLMQVKEMHDAKEAVLVDARSTASFAEGHITGAVVLPPQEAGKNPPFPSTAKVSKGSTIIVYCNGFSCHDSMEVGKLLMKAGYTSVYVYEGGFPEWKDAGFPVATGEK